MNQADSFEPFEDSSFSDIKTKIIVLKSIDNDILNMHTFGLKHLHDFPVNSHSKESFTYCKQCIGEGFYADTEGFFQCCSDCQLSSSKLILGSRYHILNQIGKGCFSATFKAIDKFCNQSEKFVAIKIINRNFTYVGITEIQVLQFLKQKDPMQHFSYVRLLDKFSLNDTFLCLVEEYLECNCTQSAKFPFGMSDQLASSTYNFDHYLMQKTQRSAQLRLFKKIMLQSLKFLAFLHSNQLIHADIKVDNLMFCKRDAINIRFIDFGNALHVSNSVHYYDTFEIQPLAYRAPEVVFGCPFDCSIDMWSVGCLMVMLWVGKGMFDDVKDESELCELIITLFGAEEVPESFREGKYFVKFSGLLKDARKPLFKEIMSENGMPIDGIELLSEMLKLDPEKRIKPREALLHSFMSEFIEPLLYCIL